MLWFKKRPEAEVADSADGTDLIVPAALSVTLDTGQFQQRYSVLLHNAEDDGGIEVYLASLEAKHQLFDRLLNPDAIEQLSMEGVEALLETVFSARRRVFSRFSEIGLASSAAAIRKLLYGKAKLLDRMTEFAEIIEIDEAADKETRKLAAKNRRAIYDFGAEMLHFNAPLKYPLMTRWVWDQNTVSGALREFIRGNDAMPDVPLGSSPEMFEGARVWLAAQLAEQGLYKDVHYWIDLIQAQAYSEYFRSMAEGMLSADFGRANSPGDYVKKFLGIDAPVKIGMSRVKRSLGDE